MSQSLFYTKCAPAHRAMAIVILMKQELKAPEDLVLKRPKFKMLVERDRGNLLRLSGDDGVRSEAVRKGFRFITESFDPPAPPKALAAFFVQLEAALKEVVPDDKLPEFSNPEMQIALSALRLFPDTGQSLWRPEVGDWLVHPMQGLARVVSIDRKLFGEKVVEGFSYEFVRNAQSQGRSFTPWDKVSASRLRPTYSEPEIKEALEGLPEKLVGAKERFGNFSFTRIRNQIQQILNQGSIEELVQLLLYLASKLDGGDGGKPGGEYMQYYKRLCHLLGSELAIARNNSLEKVDETESEIRAKIKACFQEEAPAPRSEHLFKSKRRIVSE